MKNPTNIEYTGFMKSIHQFVSNDEKMNNLFSVCLAIGLLVIMGLFIFAIFEI